MHNERLAGRIHLMVFVMHGKGAEVIWKYFTGAYFLLPLFNFPVKLDAYLLAYKVELAEWDSIS